jgi:hypothetical protein
MVESSTPADVQQALQILQEAHQDQIVAEFQSKSLEEQAAMAV